jgi:hypothetical protein
MPLLANLKTCNVKRAAAASDPVMRMRAKLVVALAEQKLAVEAEQRGEKFAATRKVKGVEQARKFRPWFWRQGKTYFVEARYGTSSIEIAGGNAIEAGDKLADVLNVLTVLSDATDAGELDAQLSKLAAKRGRKGSKGATGGVPSNGTQQGTRKRG